MPPLTAKEMRAIRERNKSQQYADVYEALMRALADSDALLSHADALVSMMRLMCCVFPFIRATHYIHPKTGDRKSIEELRKVACDIIADHDASKGGDSHAPVDDK